MNRYFIFLLLLCSLRCGPDDNQRILGFVATYQFIDNPGSIRNSVNVYVNYDRPSGRIESRKVSSESSENEDASLVLSPSIKAKVDSYLDRIPIKHTNDSYFTQTSEATPINFNFKLKSTTKTVFIDSIFSILPDGLEDLRNFVIENKFNL